MPVEGKAEAVEVALVSKENDQFVVWLNRTEQTSIPCAGRGTLCVALHKNKNAKT